MPTLENSRPAVMLVADTTVMSVRSVVRLSGSVTRRVAPFTNPVPVSVIGWDWLPRVTTVGLTDMRLAAPPDPAGATGTENGSETSSAEFWTTNRYTPAAATTSDT